MKRIVDYLERDCTDTGVSYEVQEDDSPVSMHLSLCINTYRCTGIYLAVC